MKPTRHGVKHVREDCPRDFSGLRCKRARVPHRIGVRVHVYAQVSVSVTHYFRSGEQRVSSGTLIDYKFNALTPSLVPGINSAISRAASVVRGYSRQKQRIRR